MNNERKKILLFYFLGFLFIALNAAALYFKQSVVMAGLPFVLLVLLFGFFAMDKLLWVTIFFVPLSVELQEFFPEASFNMALPTEPLLFGLLLIFLLKQALDQNYDKRVLRHPVSIVIYVMLGWMLITSITSTMPWVSIKYFFSRLWFIVGFYFLMILILKKEKNRLPFFWVYIIPFLIVIAITFTKHASFGFSQKSAHFVMHPFYKDHTSYGAALAMYLPVLIGMLSLKRYSGFFKYLITAVLALFTLSIVLSYTRAAWVSLLAALFVYLIIRLKINYKWILTAMVVTVSLFFVMKTDIMIMLEQNKTDSSTDFKEHVKSISNVATDASNMERINRWNCAVRMFKEKPVLGWGPGTYQFNYAPFQKSYEKTIISTNAGDMGNAHSEYLGPLSESGVIGMLSVVALLIVVIATALHRYKNTDDKDTRTLLLMALTGLITYFTHGFLNNFLDTDKASAPFWGFIAMIVAIDVYHRNKDDKAIESHEEK